MDFDGDGTLDLVSGSYDPGELYLFRGQGGGKFAAREVIKDKSGKPILKVPDQKDRGDSFGSWLALVDWDGDGDLDLLVGTFEGTMFLRRNDGTRTKPAYAAENEWVTVGSKRLRVPGGAHANPVIADWDGDGLWDIVTGSGDGGVYWYRNAGKPGKPAFAAPVVLVPKHDGSGYRERFDGDATFKPGIRSQIAVADYDGDGKLDVLLGDFCTYLKPRDDLTPADRQAFTANVARQAALEKQIQQTNDALREKWAEFMKAVPPADRFNKENSARWQKAMRGLREYKELDAAGGELGRLRAAVAKYVQGDAKRGSADVAHGFVWVFRRR